ncbi:hypothetical protein [Verrucosispora sioxanthis]|uniref:hypothetical protein n=1 Tax=Verrucosispora sioxanthis TaxID=2499994 RepID=UPI001C10A7F5|nr:hypothetical protein [Verrucosispora sioxanthis]
MNPDRLFDLAAEFAHATGNAERFHARAAVATGDDRAAHEKAASRWEAIAARRTPDGTRTVRVRYTPAQATAAAVALIACAAITDDPDGSTLASILPAFPPNPPGDEPVTTDEGRPA